MPIAIAGSTTGMAGMSISKLRQVLVSMGGSDTEVLSAPLSISLLLVGGTIVVACASAASVVLIALRPRQHDAQLLYTSGATDELLTQKTLMETLVYLILAGIIAYGTVIINDVCMTFAFARGPLPMTRLSMPAGSTLAVLCLGIGIAATMLWSITLTELRRNTTERTLSHAAPSA